MTTIIVQDSAGLVSALKSAQAGDSIKLAPGDYAPVMISGISIPGGVTISSLDATNPAAFTKLIIKESEGLNFQNVEFVVDPSIGTNPFQVLSSNKISFDRLDVHGSLDGDASNDVAALLIRSSTNVTVSNSEFQQLQHAISHLNSDGLTVSGNHFHDIRTDGVRGGGSSQVTISDNYFTDFHPVTGDHPDAIQFWTTQTDHIARDIVVTGNVIVRGSGDPIQGIFFRDQVGNLPYQNVLVSGNFVLGGLYNGIAVCNSDGITIVDNTVVGLPDQTSWIAAPGSINVTLTNNGATKYGTFTESVTSSGNTTIEVPQDGGASLLQQWQVSVAAEEEPVETVAATPAPTAEVTITGTSGADRLSVDGVRNTLVDAGDGDDVLSGGGEAFNTLAGGAGDDTYYVRSARDTVVEQADGGSDLVVAYVDVTLSDNVEALRMMSGATYGGGNSLGNKITGTADGDEIRGFDGDDLLMGLEGNDQLFGGAGADVLSGGAGNDTVAGEGEDDRLGGAEGFDSLAGGAGADTLEGGVGADTMSGGTGADLFFFRHGDLSLTSDVILDFNRAEGDLISLGMIDANSKKAGDQKFDFIGTRKFSHGNGQLRYDVVDGDAHVQMDIDGDGVADMTIVIVGQTTLQSSDFLL